MNIRSRLSGKQLRKSLLLCLILFLLMNMVAFMHAYKFTHFSTPSPAPVHQQGGASSFQKVKLLLTGVDNPRPGHQRRPPVAHEVVRMGAEGELEGWIIDPDTTTIGTVLLFHGYGGEKSSLIDKALIFRDLGYQTLLVDFMGSGGSSGNRTTIGYQEADQVLASIDFIRSRGARNLHLFGTSMGAAAILKTMADRRPRVSSIMIECPFGSMSEAVGNRFDRMGLPRFPMAHLLLFWGGVQNGFWAYAHNPATYARSVSCPALLMYGEKDPKVSRGETDRIFRNLNGPKQLLTFPNAGHENYLLQYRQEWTEGIRGFLKKR